MKRLAVAFRVVGLVAFAAVLGCNDGFDDPVETDVGEAEVCERVATWESNWVAWEEDLVRGLNAARAEKLQCDGIQQKRQRALRVIPELTCAARLQAKELAEVGGLTHAGVGGGYVSRLDVVGYLGVPTAELLAIDIEAPSKVVDQWMAETDSCSAMLGPSEEAVESAPYSDEVGVGLMRDDDDVVHWVVALAQRRE